MSVIPARNNHGDQWLTLSEIAARLGHDEMAERFRAALVEEEDHLARVRAWVASSVEVQVGLNAGEGDVLDESREPPAP